MFSQGFCYALIDTNFEGRQCLFFKKKVKHKANPEGPSKPITRWTKLPRLNLRLESIMTSADKKKDLFTVDSENIDYKFIADSEDILIMSHKDGYLRVPLEEVEDLAHEVSEVAEVVRLWRRGRT